MSILTRKIGDIAKVKGGKRLPKGMSVLDAATEHPYLRVVDFGDGGIDRSDIKYIDNVMGLDFSGHTGKRELSTEECVL